MKSATLIFILAGIPFLSYHRGYKNGVRRVLENPSAFEFTITSHVFDTRKMVRFFGVNTEGSEWAILTGDDATHVIFKDGKAINTGFVAADRIIISPVELVNAINGGKK